MALEEVRSLRSRVPAVFVAKRLGLLLSSLSLCLRVGSLQQSSSTTDFHYFVFACRGGFAALAAGLDLAVDSTIG